MRAISAPTLSEATQQYLQLKGMGKAKTFHQAAVRNAGTVIEICGNRVVTQYRTIDAGQVPNVLIDKGLSVLSVRRSFTTMKLIKLANLQCAYENTQCSKDDSAS